MTIHDTTEQDYEHASERARRWRMRHPVDAMRAASPDSIDQGFYVGPLMAREDGSLWYGDSRDDYDLITPFQWLTRTAPITMSSMHAMHVYTDGAVWVVAHSPDDAAVVLLGEEDAEDGEFELVPDGDELTITDDDPTDDNDGEETRTCREWANSFDRPGILASTED